MDRRRFLLISLAGAVAGPLAAEAQQAGKVYRIGILELRSSHLNAANLDAFRQALLALGYKEGQNLEITYRSSDGRDERFPGLARELVDLKVNLIVTRGTPAALAAKSATRTIPVVMASAGDPVGTGLVASLGRPGGNVTGLSVLNVELYAKRIELLREMLPRLTRIAGLFNMGNPVLLLQWKEVQRAARSLGIQPHLLDVRRPEDLPRAFDAAAKERAEALLVAIDGVTLGNLRPIADLAVKHRLPSIYPVREYADLGGLITNGWSDPHQYQRAATFVDKILKGANPGDPPVEQPTKFDLVINLKTAKALGLSIPPSVLARADQVIEYGAQQAAKIPRVGVLFASTPAATSHLLDGLRKGLLEHRYVEGQDFILEPRYGQAGRERMSDLASQLVRTKVDIIVAATDPATAAARQQTRTIPIVMANSTDPVGSGFVASLGRPGGNVTGLSAQSPELGGKRLELLREVVPGLARAAIIWNPDVRGALFDYKETETVARAMGLQLQSAEITRGEDIDVAFSDVASRRAQALIVQTPNPILFASRIRLASLALKARLPSMYGQREYAEAGGLIAYGPSTVDLFHRAATYVDKILKGAKPADLPVEQPRKFELVINMKTAKALGLTIPPSLLARADQVIE